MLNVLKIVNKDNDGAVFSNSCEVYIDDVEMTGVQSIDVPIELNEWVCVTMKFVPGKIEWVNMAPQDRISVHKSGHFVRGAWVWDD